MILTGVHRSTLRKACHIAALSATGLVFNSGFRGERQTNNLLSHDLQQD